MSKAKLRAILSLLVLYVLLPALGVPAVLGMLKIWIYFAVGVTATLTQPDYAPTARATPVDRGSFRLLMLALYLTQLLSILEANYLRYPASYAWTPLAGVALALSLSGLGLRAWAVRTLGRFFSLDLRVAEDQTVVDRGPYRLIRHPSYTGGLLIYPGMSLFFGAYWSLALSVVILIPAFLYRIRVEEGLLLDRLGEPYRAYRARTGALVPWL